MKTNKNEELQSRREFFKSAAKAALPVIGAVVLANVPIAKSVASTGCDSSCRGYCVGCYGSCQETCKGACSSGCYTRCYHSSSK